MNAIRIFVAKRHEVTRKGLVVLLSMIDGLEVVGEAADDQKAIAQSHIKRPDVILIDLYLPRFSRAEVIQRIHQDAPQARFIVLSTFDHDEDIWRALDAGANACLLAGMATDELVATIRCVHGGHRAPLSVGTQSQFESSRLSYERLKVGRFEVPIARPSGTTQRIELRVSSRWPKIFLDHGGAAACCRN